MLSADEIAQFIGEQINKLSNEGYKQFLNHHLISCERYELLGYSSHILYVSKKSIYIVL